MRGWSCMKFFLLFDLGGILFLSSLSFCNSFCNIFCPSVIMSETLTLLMSARALIFHMSIPCDKTIPWVPTVLILWPWPWSLIYFLKTFTLLIIFEQCGLELWYSLWEDLFMGTNIFYPVTLTLEFGLLF